MPEPDTARPTTVVSHKQPPRLSATGQSNRCRRSKLQDWSYADARDRAQPDKALTRAQKRMTAAVRERARVRRLRTPAILATLNVATTPNRGEQRGKWERMTGFRPVRSGSDAVFGAFGGRFTAVGRNNVEYCPEVPVRRNPFED